MNNLYFSILDRAAWRIDEGGEGERGKVILVDVGWIVA